MDRADRRRAIDERHRRATLRRLAIDRAIQRTTAPAVHDQTLHRLAEAIAACDRDPTQQERDAALATIATAPTSAQRDLF